MTAIPGAVELDGNALSPQSLYLALINAASSTQEKISEGANQLALWEKQPGFYSGLQTIFVDTSLPFEVRYLAAIQIKNGIDKYWRKTAANAISKEEKNIIRSRCLEAGINEADRRLALQNAIFVAKIVRFEYPADWPDAISSVVNFLRETAREDRGSVHLPRTLLILLYIIKELSTARLQRSRISLQKVAPDILQVLGTVYVDKVNSWMTFLKTGGNNEAGAINDVDVSLLALRVLRRLLICGFEHPNRDASVQEFWGIIRGHFSEMFALTLHHGQQLSVREQLEKHLIQISKLHLKMIQDHPAAFAQLSGSIDIAKSYWQILLEFSKSFGTQSIAVIGTDGDADDEISYIEKLSLKGLLILRACVKMVYYPAQTFKYQYAADKEERQQSKDAMKDAILSPDMVREIMETLVTRFFVFRAKDLREWEEEPSEWERREEGEGETWEFSVRVCAEKLFLDLVINNKDLLIQPLLQVFNSVATLEVTDVLYKDSIYAAIGLAAPILHQHLDFDTFLSTVLVPEVQAVRPGYNILRRRIAILLGQWVVVKNINRNLVYSIFEHILKKNDPLNDIVVRVTAGRQLEGVINPLDVEIDQFIPHAASILSTLGALVQEVELPETRLALLQTFSAVIVRMERQVTPFADAILSILPPLWDQAGDEFLTKQVILGILSALVTSMQADSRKYHSIIIPLIESSIQVDSETRSWLLEDALDLWSTVLEQADEVGNLLSLVKHIRPLFELASEALQKGLEITEQYVLLAPQAMLEQSLQFTADFRDLISHNNAREARLLVSQIVDILFQAATAIGGRPAVAKLAHIINESNFLQQILLALKSAYDAHQTTGPNRMVADIDDVVETRYFTILARILLFDPATFFAVVSDALSEPVEAILAWLLSEWFSHSDSIAYATQKKLMCLALTNLLDLDLPMRQHILSRLQEFMGLWTDIVGECMEYTDDEPEGRDTLLWAKPATAAAAEDQIISPLETRRRNLAYEDPVRTLHIKQYIRMKLLRAIELSGGQEAFQRDWLANVDRDVVQSFSSLAII